MKLALHMMRGEGGFITHSHYVENLVKMPFSVFIREKNHVKELAVLLEDIFV